MSNAKTLFEKVIVRTLKVSGDGRDLVISLSDVFRDDLCTVLVCKNTFFLNYQNRTSCKDKNVINALVKIMLLEIPKEKIETYLFKFKYGFYDGNGHCYNMPFSTTKILSISGENISMDILCKDVMEEDLKIIDNYND
jgi:hypothetical protein